MEYIGLSILFYKFSHNHGKNQTGKFLLRFKIVSKIDTNLMKRFIENTYLAENMTCMVAVIHWNCNPVIISIGSLGLRYYSLCWVVGFILGYIYVKHTFKREGLDTGLLGTLLIYVCVGALVGARLGHCLFYDFQYYSKHVLEIFLPVSFDNGSVKFTGYSGLASHGGAIGVAIALVLFNRKYHIPLLSLLDKLALAAPLAGAFIRIGNFFNSEILGAPTTFAAAVVFERVDNIPRHPAQLYEALAYLLIFCFLIIIYNRKNRIASHHGKIFVVSITMIFTARFLIEYLKEVQEAFEVGLRSAIGMDMGQLLSIPFILAGLYFTFRPDK